MGIDLIRACRIHIHMPTQEELDTLSDLWQGAIESVEASLKMHAHMREALDAGWMKPDDVQRSAKDRVTSMLGPYEPINLFLGEAKRLGFLPADAVSRIFADAKAVLALSRDVTAASQTSDRVRVVARLGTLISTVEVAINSVGKKLGRDVSTYDQRVEREKQAQADEERRAAEERKAAYARDTLAHEEERAGMTPEQRRAYDKEQLKKLLHQFVKITGDEE